jgi:hypothetical protein
MRASLSLAPIAQREANVKHLAPAADYGWFAHARTEA